MKITLLDQEHEVMTRVGWFTISGFVDDRLANLISIIQEA